MKTAPQIVWHASGSPRIEGVEAHGGLCYVCVGRMQRGVPVETWFGTNYVDQNRARSPEATHVCEACVFVHARTSLVPGRPPKEGKTLGGNFRNYSHLWEEDTGYFNASKGEKPLIREFLAKRHTAPWFAGIADSGQKHVLPFVPLNGPGRSGRVLFDEVLIQVPEDQSLVGNIISLLTAGASKDEVSTGGYSAAAYQRCMGAILHFEREHGAQRHSAWFQLALWLAQRENGEPSHA